MNLKLIFPLALFGGVAQGQDLPTENLRVREILTIPRQKKDWLVGVQDAVSLRDGSIIVSDKLDNKLKKFDSKGRLVKETGKRGKGAGEFRGPGPLSVWNDLVAVVDYASSRIQVFTSDLQFKSALQAGGSIFDLCFDQEGYLWVGLLRGRQGRNLVQLDLKGEVVQAITLRNATKDPFDNMFWFTIDKTGEIIVAYVAQNKIELWNTRGEFRRDFHVSGLPLRSKRKTISKRIFDEDLEVPEDNIFWDVGVDSQGRIFLLADEYTPNPDQDVYVVNREGDLLSILKLPHRSMTLTVDSRDRLIVTDIGKTTVRVLGLQKTGRREGTPR